MIHLARATGEPRAGCSKGSSSKAEASEEVRTALRVPVRPYNESWRTDKPLISISNIRRVPLNVELLSDARTTLAGFFSILPMKEGRT